MLQRTSRRERTAERWAESGADIERIVYFSDAVFAIAITILVLNLRLPEIPASQAASVLPGAIAGLWPKFLSYVISFVLIGNYWAAHHRAFRFIRRYDRRLISLNICFLMCVAFLPFPVSLMSEYGSLRISLVIYLGSLIVTGLVLVGMVLYATHSRLTDPDLNPGLRHFLAKGMAVPVACAIGIGVSFLSMTAAYFALLLIGPVRILLYKYLVRFERETERGGLAAGSNAGAGQGQ